MEGSKNGPLNFPGEKAGRECQEQTGQENCRRRVLTYQLARRHGNSPGHRQLYNQEKKTLHGRCKNDTSFCPGLTDAVI